MKKKFHVGCGGELVFSHIKKVKAGKKTIEKQMYQCQKCNALINVVECPSYEEYVIRGQIRVSRAEYRRIKEQYKTVVGQ